MEAPVLSAEGALADRRPLVLDLDHTLIRTDVLHELALAYVKANPFRVFLLVAWLLRGKTHLKHQLSTRVTLNVDALPANEEIVALAREHASAGRPIVLATASDGLIARRIARRFGFIGQVIGTENGVNLKGREKARRLAEMFPDGFDYVGDSRPDLEVWTVARNGIVVSDSRSLVRRAERVTSVQRHFAGGGSPTAMLRAMRPHQWAKNVLVFAPLVLAGITHEPAAWVMAALAFLALSLIASGTYILNDLFDLQDDRLHWSKRNRPIASGELAIPRAVLLCASLIVAGVAIALLTNLFVVALLAVYGGLTVAYSLTLKRQPITDAFVLATLFTLRIGIGIAAVGAESSAWLLVFSMFLFGSLSLAKRYTEIARMREHGHRKTSGRGYLADDAGLVLTMGISSGIGAIVIMVLYLIEDAFAADFYLEPALLWSFPAILFLWVSRIWLLSSRGELNDDPVAFAVRDRTSIVLGAGMVLTFIGAMTGLPGLTTL